MLWVEKGPGSRKEFQVEAEVPALFEPNLDD
jgi:hypothetical protein